MVEAEDDDPVEEVESPRVEPLEERPYEEMSES